MIESSIVVRVHEGLHTRPAAHMAKLAKAFDCSLELVCRGVAANAKSSVKLMLLGVKEGDEVLVRAEGQDESHAVERLMQDLVDPRSGLEEAKEGTAAPADAAPTPAQSAGEAVGGNCIAGVAGSK